MKKVLIITYYWPPCGGSGVQRWLKFTKYLAKKNYHCIIYTPSSPESPVIDNSLLKDIPQNNYEVIKTEIFEPYKLYRFFTNKNKSEKITTSFLSENSTNKKLSLKEKISRWVRGNFFIPDARMFWIKPSVKYLSDYLKKNKIDIIITTGPPHSMHLIGLGIKKKYPNIKWIADFRDPWTNIDFINDLHLTTFALKKHAQLEKEVVRTADKIITVSYTLTNELKALCPHNNNNFYTITNGFDSDDFEIIAHSQKKQTNQFIITYAGLLPPNRNPLILWEALAELSEKKLLNKEIKIQLIGKSDISVWNAIKDNNIAHLVEKIDYLPHSEVIKKQADADALLLLINRAPNSKGILTGKLFEYLASNKPIIAIGPTDGDAAKIIKESNAGFIIDYDDIESMKQTLLTIINTPIVTNNSAIQKFSREALTNELIKLIES